MADFFAAFAVALREEGDAQLVLLLALFQALEVALREEGDAQQLPRIRADLISIHALREEGDGTTRSRFLHMLDFNPRPPRGGRLRRDFRHHRRLQFQSTPSARRATTTGADDAWSQIEFQSTPSARRATQERLCAEGGLKISIHALREEGDKRARDIFEGDILFQSTPSARRATASNVALTHTVVFQSTPSARRAWIEILPCRRGRRR